MSDSTANDAIEHGMIAGSHERPAGPECRCGAQWSRADNLCAATAPWSLLSAKGQAERLASMPKETAGQAIEHVEATGHSVDWNDECHLWACFDCSWTDSNFVPTIPPEPVSP